MQDLEAKHIGLCALCLGIKRTCKLLNEPTERVEAFTSLVRYENTPFFAKVANKIKNYIETEGFESTHKVFSLDEQVLKFLNTGKIDDVETRDEEDQSEVKAKSVVLYTKGVQVGKIVALFDLPSAEIVHSWNEWRRYNPDKAESSRQTKKRIISLIETGHSLTSIARSLDMNEDQVRHYIGDMSRKKAYFNREDLRQIALEYVRVKNMSQVTSKYECSKECVISCYENLINHKPINENRVVESDDEADSVTKRRILEDYYITKDIKLTASCAGKTVNLIQSWVKNFENKVFHVFTMQEKTFA